MNRIFVYLKFPAAFAALALSAGAQAVPWVDTTGLVSPTLIQNFDIPILTNGDAPGTSFAGLSFSSNVVITNIGDLFAPPNLQNQVISNATYTLDDGFVCPSGGCGAISDIYFSTPLTAAAFVMATNPGTSTFSAFLGNDFVEGFNVPTDIESDWFYGFTGITFNRVQINAGGENNVFVLDNLQMVPVPEPETYALMLAGLGLLGIMVRRRLHR